MYDVGATLAAAGCVHAIAVMGLVRDGRTEQAAALTAGILRAAEGFGYRLPELYGGDSADDVPFPSAYPAACRPRAWAAGVRAQWRRGPEEV